MSMERLAIGLGEVKFAQDQADGTFTGYGAAFGNVDSYGDVIKQGAFKRTLKEAKKAGRWPAMLSQHGGWGMSSEDMMPIGVWTSIEEDDHGLKVEGKLALDTRRGADAYALLKMTPRPALDGMSIGYVAKKFTVGTKVGEPRRMLEDVELLEISLVTWPANGAARVEGVKAAPHIQTVRQFEDFLRDVGGFSHAAAKAISAGGFKAAPDPRDEDAAADFVALQERFRRLSA